MLLPTWALSAQTITLRGQVDLVAQRVALGDLGTLVCDDQPGCSNLASLVVSTPPRPGHSITLSRTQLQAALRNTGSPLANSLVWLGADSVKVTTSAQRIAPERLISVAEDAIALAHGRVGLEVSGGKLQEPVLVNMGQLSLRPRKLLGLPRSILSVDVDIYVGEQYQRTVSVPMSIKLYRPVMRARRALGAGSPLNCQDFEVQESDIARLTVALAQTEDCTKNVSLRYPLKRGEFLEKKNLTPSLAIHQGEKVKLSIVVGNVYVETLALALKNGQVGETITVRPSQASATLRAHVTANGKVTLLEKP